MGACTFANRVEQATVDGKRAVEIDVTMSSSYATGGDTIAISSIGLNVIDRVELLGTPVSNGIATSATSTTLVDTTKTGPSAWTVNAFTGFLVRIVQGTGVGQARKITSNTANTLTVPTWTITPDATSRYVVEATLGRDVRFDYGVPTFNAGAPVPPAPTVMLFSAAGTELAATTNVSTTVLRARFIGS